MNTIKNLWNRTCGFIKTNANKVAAAVALGVALLKPAAAHAADPTSVAEAVTAVQALPATMTTTYIAAVVIGIGILTIGLVVYVLRRGVKLR